MFSSLDPPAFGPVMLVRVKFPAVNFLKKDSRLERDVTGLDSKPLLILGETTLEPFATSS